MIEYTCKCGISFLVDSSCIGRVRYCPDGHMDPVAGKEEDDPTAKEREACANVADNEALSHLVGPADPQVGEQLAIAQACKNIANRIRARKTPTA